MEKHKKKEVITMNTNLKRKGKINKEKQSIAIYHQVKKHENFEKSAEILFNLIKDAQKKAPNQKRILFLDIEGHKNSVGGFDRDMVELQVDFVPEFLSQWLSEVNMPLAHFEISNQKNNIPDYLSVQGG
jgi:hypothetical protein